MSRTDDYRQQAEFCEQQAAKISDHAVREHFMTLARQWRDLAQSVELLDQRPLKPD